MLTIPSNTEIKYKGKSKDVYELKDGTILLDFNHDNFTVNEKGLEDPGGNKNSEKSLPGIGITNLALTTYFYSLFEKLGIRTHLIESNIEKGLMHVKKIDIFGDGVVLPELPLAGKNLGKVATNVEVGGIEVINRRYFTGSYIRRNDDFDDMSYIDPSFVEFTIKNDKEGDPWISKTLMIDNKIMTQKEIDETKCTSRKIELTFQTLLKDKGVEVIDFKTEHGRYKEQSILADELAAGSMRVRNIKEKRNLNKFEIATAFLGEEIITDIKQGQTKGINAKVGSVLEKTLKRF